MENASIQSKVLILESSENAIAKIRSFFSDKGLIGLKATSQSILKLLQTNTDLGAVFLSEHFENEELTGTELAQKINHQRPELPIFVRKDKLAESDVESASTCEYYSINDMERLNLLVDNHLFSRFYPMPLIRGIQEISREAFQSNIFDIEVTCDPPYLVKDNIIFGELFSLIPLESEWCRGYMMLQTTKSEVIDMISNKKTHLDQNATDFRDVNGLLNEITNLIWGGIRSKFFQSTEESESSIKTQVPILINHNEKYISFGTAEPQLCFRYSIKDLNNDSPSIVIYQKLIFNLDWRPEAFKESDQAVDDMVDSGELELF
jgi:hypothetical protein